MSWFVILSFFILNNDTFIIICGEYRARTDELSRWKSGCSKYAWADLLFSLFLFWIMIRLSLFVENIGLEPMTPCVQGRCSKPTELIPRLFSFFIYATLACDVNGARTDDLSRCKSGCSKSAWANPPVFFFRFQISETRYQTYIVLVLGSWL